MPEVKFDHNMFFDALSRAGHVLTAEQRKQLTDRLENALSYEPRVGVFGKCGAGKSSLCNAIFGQDVCEISHIAACTRKPQEVLVNIGTKGLKLVDVPGVGESESRDREYEQLYRSLLPELDIVLWLLKGDERAYESDERFYKAVVCPHLDQGKPFFFVISQSDKIEPYREWDVAKHCPGPIQAENIRKKITHVSEIFKVDISKVVAVSAQEKWNLFDVVSKVVAALPKDKKLTFLNRVDPVHVSTAAMDEAKKGFFDFAWEVAKGVVVNLATAAVSSVLHAAGALWRLFK